MLRLFVLLTSSSSTKILMGGRSGNNKLQVFFQVKLWKGAVLCYFRRPIEWREN